jgi:hypothetical protein
MNFWSVRFECVTSRDRPEIEAKRILERTRRRLEDDIEMDLKEIGWEGVDWIHLAKDSDKWRAVLDTAITFRVP